MNKLKKKLLACLGFTFVPLIFSLNTSAEIKMPKNYSEYLTDKPNISKRQLRGIWITTAFNLDWPSSTSKTIKDTNTRIAKCKQELISILDRGNELNINAIFFQVSSNADALYKSDIVPWSSYLTGTFGKDPGFDPLKFIVEEAHKRNMELHAWFNPLRVSTEINDNTKSILNIDKSVYQEHPNWIKTSYDRFVIDPGIPEARQWVISRVMEVAENYDVDGIHFDDYFYYEKYAGEMNDEDTFKKYNIENFTKKADWRRNNTYLLIRELSKKIREKKSWLKFGISPAAVWGNKQDGHADGSDTTAGIPNYDSAFADTKKWVEEEIIDYIAPQIYFSFANKHVPFGTIAAWWADVCKGKNVHLYTGHALYKINDDKDTYFNGENAIKEFSNQLKFNNNRSEILGCILFRNKNISDSKKQDVINAIDKDVWSTKALVPTMQWKNGLTPPSPINGKMEGVDNGIKLSWEDNSKKTSYYAIYRYNNGESGNINNDESANHLIGTIRKNNTTRQEFIDSNNNDLSAVFYIISALDRLHNESNGLKVLYSYSKYFFDINVNYNWAAESIDYLYEKGIIKGIENGIYSPERNVKRADFLIMIVKAFNLQADFTDNFIDIEPNSYYYKEVGICKKLDIVKGSGTNFYPSKNITREDVMVILLRVLNYLHQNPQSNDISNLKNYADANEISEYAKEAVSILIGLKIISGDKNMLKPKSNTTRAELAVILKRAIDFYKNYL